MPPRILCLETQEYFWLWKLVMCSLLSWLCYDVFLTFLFHLPDFCPINLIQFILVAVSVLRLITVLPFSLETETNKPGL